MSLSTTRVSLEILLLRFVIFTVAGVQPLTITPDTGTTINIISTQVNSCKVCKWAGIRCSTSLLVKDSTSVNFRCPRPQDVFRVEIVRNIECTAKSCSGHIIQADSGSLPLLDFNRTFTWNLKASEALKAFKIDFTKTGLRQIHPSEICPDRHTYVLQSTGNVVLGKYCRMGIISSAQILNVGSFFLEVPAGQKLQNGQFDVSVGEEIKSLAKITLTFPMGTLSSELLSPNYPDSFPDDNVMEWYFQVPDKHEVSVQFLNLTHPHCLKKETAVEYRSKGRAVLVQSLMDPQPDQNWGNISLMLRNCEMDRRRSGSPGLSVNLKVSSSSIQASSAAMLTFILCGMTALLAIFVIVAVVTCLMIKKKKIMNHQTSIYNPNSINVLPGHNHFPKTHADNESHVYATIDETLIYSDLLKGCAEVNPYTEIDTNQPFTGYTDSQKPLITNL